MRNEKKRVFRKRKEFYRNIKIPDDCHYLYSFIAVPVAMYYAIFKKEYSRNIIPIGEKINKFIILISLASGFALWAFYNPFIIALAENNRYINLCVVAIYFPTWLYISHFYPKTIDADMREHLEDIIASFCFYILFIIWLTSRIFDTKIANIILGSDNLILNIVQKG